MIGVCDNYEEAISDCQELSFDTLESAFAKLKLEFDEAQKADLGLINEDGRYTNLALLLSEQCRHTIKVAKFEKVTKCAKFQQEFSGSVLKQFNEAYDFISKSFNAQFLNTDFPYPGRSLEESLLNAVIHRNYSIPGSILVKGFPNNIEVISPGGISSACSRDDIMQGISLLRNAKLAAIFRRLGLVELLGRGIQHIIRPYAFKPQIKATENVFKVQMFNNNIYGTRKLSEREIKIIEYLLENQIIARSDAAKMLKIDEQAAARVIKALHTAGTLKRIGSGKDTKYILYSSEYEVEEELPKDWWVKVFR